MNFWDQIAAEKHLLDYPHSPHGPVGMIYPNAYSIGMASLGYQQVYRLFREAGMAVERFFFDKKGRETRGVENRSPLFRIPILAASFTYELDLINLLKMLLRGGVEILSEQRGEEFPLLIIGGQAASNNPRLLERIADAVVLGEAEGIIPPLTEALIQTKNQSRREKLETIAQIPHIYVPLVHGESGAERIQPFRMDLCNAPSCNSAILAKNDEFGGALLLELSRGCSHRCNFCVVHYRNGPARYREYGSLIETLERHKDSYHKVGLLGAAVAGHPQVEEIAEWIVKQGKQVSISSLRVEKLSGSLLDSLHRGGMQTLTIAPETGSFESRKRLRKGIQDERFFELAEQAGKRGFPNLKLYFLIGCPESDPMREAEEIAQFSERINEIFTKNGGRRLTAAISPFVPKPYTPWADEPFWNPKQVKKASRLIRKLLTFRGNIKTPPVNVKEARAETVLSWAGSEITEELIQIASGDNPPESAFMDYDLSRLQRDSAS